jgi:hypothetical protein
MACVAARPATRARAVGGVSVARSTDIAVALKHIVMLNASPHLVCALAHHISKPHQMDTGSESG